MDDFAGGFDIVVIPVDLNQACVGQYTVHIIVETAVLGHNAVFKISFRICGALNGRRIHHFALIIEDVAAFRHQIIGFGDPIAAAMDDFAGCTHIVEVAVNLDQACIVQFSVYIVVEAVVFGHNAVFHFRLRLCGVGCGRIHHFAVFIESIASLGQKAIGLGDPVAAVIDHLAGAAHIVIVAVDLDQPRVGQYAVHIVIQAAVLGHDAVLHFRFGIRGRFGIRLRCGRIHHFAVLAEAVHPLGEEIIGLGDPIAAAMDKFAAAADIVVVPVNLNQARIGQHAVHIVVEAVVLGNNAVFHFRFGICRIGVDRIRIGHGRIGHSALIIKGIASFRHKAVGLADPVAAALDRSVHNLIVVIGEVIVVTVDQYQTGIGNNNTVFNQVGVSGPVIQAGLILLPDTVFIKRIEYIYAFNIECIQTRSCILAGAEVIFLAVNGHPLLGHPLAGPHIFDSFFIADKITAGQNLVREDVMIPADGLLAVNGVSGNRIKIVIHGFAGTIVDGTPAGFQRAVDRVICIAVQFEKSGYLTLGNSVIAEIVVIAVFFILITRNLVNAGHRCVINEVVEIISGLSPALPIGLVQRKAVLKGGIGGAEVGALFVGIVGVDEGDQTIGLLNAGIAGYGIQCVGTEINVVAHLAGVGYRQTAVLIPLGIGLRSGLDSAENANGVSCRRVNGLGLVDPVADQRQRMALVVKFRGRHGEILIHQDNF